MYQSASKFNPKLSSKSVSKFSTPSNNSSLKRKRPDEPFQRYVVPKLTPSYDLQNKKLSSMPNPFKNSNNNTPVPVYRANKMSVQSKTTVPTPVQTSSKNMSRISVTAKNTVEKFPIHAPNHFGMNIEPRNSMFGFTPIKKSLRSKDFEELVCFPKKFDNEKDDLLSNLNNLAEELSEKHNPLLEEANEKLYSLEAEYQLQKSKQKEALSEVSNKIESLRQSHSSLKKEVEVKIDKREQVEQTKQSFDFNKNQYNESINKTKNHLSQLLKKNEDLNSFIFNMEQAIQNKRGIVRARFTEISQEQRKVQVLKELVHEKKENIQ